MEFQTSVRDLVDFVHRKGGLGGDGLFRSSNRAVEGTRGHRRIQQSRIDADGAYEAEVTVEHREERHGIQIVLTGRVDGVLASATPPVVEEIKTTDRGWSGHPDPLHLAQLRTYGAILAQQHGWPAVDLRLTYLDLATGLETLIRDVEPAESLAGFLDESLHEWYSWLGPRVEWLRRRNASIAELPFPFRAFRGGQRDLARAVYRSIRDGKNLFVEAPTGLGKTLATLYPAVRALPLLGPGQVFYVTAKTPGRIAASDALAHLRSAGAELRSIALTAKSKICFAETSSGCDLRTCPYAIGYYDRAKPAIRELLGRGHLDRTAIEDTARRHQVCPFELSLDASVWTDLVIGDFNHVFDPAARLQRHFAEGPSRHVVLVDEAHNLVDRSRDMHSASLAVSDLVPGSGAAKGKGAAKARRALEDARNALEEFLRSSPPDASVVPPRDYHDGAAASAEAPKTVIAVLRESARAIEAFLSALRPGTNLTGWLEPWFALCAFLRAAECFDETCRTIVSPGDGRLTIFCADPSKRLRESLRGLRAAVFFSATLSPMEYFQDLLGGTEDDRRAVFDSPFHPDQMKLAIAPLNVTFKGRAASLTEVAERVSSHLASHPGNHLVFCPSLAYLNQLVPELQSRFPSRLLFAQKAMMDEMEREAFLSRFVPGADGVGLAVLGGIFAEGVDLPGDRLVGVTVIGVGLPRLSIERDILQGHFSATRGAGFDYAYRFPGMQRVLQAIGRLIRSETDRGSALLIDHRFEEVRYRNLFPHWWNGPPSDGKKW
ncbi:MAG TPA: helicase C-terminal domain-containing protein [Terrimicrobiaceae bacterium]|nr:helicase C-terminal domain-containing protein [Terrimicrobiaceae bacterium]